MSMMNLIQQPTILVAIDVKKDIEILYCLFVLYFSAQPLWFCYPDYSLLTPTTL